eukprot:365481-Chlamydomonas_euryale.AAC.5
MLPLNALQCLATQCYAMQCNATKCYAMLSNSMQVCDGAEPAKARARCRRAAGAVGLRVLSGPAPVAWHACGCVPVAELRFDRLHLICGGHPNTTTLAGRGAGQLLAHLSS